MRESRRPVHARPVSPNAVRAPSEPPPVERVPGRPSSLRRIVAAPASAVLPGLGQLVNGRILLALVIGAPVLATLAFVALVVRGTALVELAATLVDPAVLRTLMTVSLVVLAVRLMVVLHAFFDRRYRARPTLLEAAGLLLALGLVAAPHAVGHWYAGAAEAAFGRFFQVDLVASGSSAEAPAPVAPADDERLNVLIVGIDSRKGHQAVLTDTMMLASLDRTLGTASLISIPRDTINVPLGNGDKFGPKLNSLYAYATRHPEEFPNGPMRALEDAVGALLKAPVHYYAVVDFDAFVRLVDEAGGVDVHLEKALVDPEYPGMRKTGGLRIEAGDQRLDGALALAYVRSRHSADGSDFARAGRQQEVIVGLRDRLLEGGSVFFRLPALLDTFGDHVRTDLPPSMLPSLAAVLDAKGVDTVRSVVIQRPLVKSGNRSPYGSVQIPRIKAIREMAAALMPPPGTPSAEWPPADPTTARSTTP
jgi:LCP family protein required for cell wall assembly